MIQDKTITHFMNVICVLTQRLGGKVEFNHSEVVALSEKGKGLHFHTEDGTTKLEIVDLPPEVISDNMGFACLREEKPRDS